MKKRSCVPIFSILMLFVVSCSDGLVDDLETGLGDLIIMEDLTHDEPDVTEDLIIEEVGDLDITQPDVPDVIDVVEDPDEPDLPARTGETIISFTGGGGLMSNQYHHLMLYIGGPHPMGDYRSEYFEIRLGPGAVNLY